MIDFEKTILPLNTLIAFVINNELNNQISDLSRKYKEALLVNPSSVKEYDHILKDKVIQVLKLLSKKYRKLLLNNYFSEQGLIYYIYNTLLTADISAFTKEG